MPESMIHLPRGIRSYTGLSVQAEPAHGLELKEPSTTRKPKWGKLVRLASHSLDSKPVRTARATCGIILCIQWFRGKRNASETFS